MSDFDLAANAARTANDDHTKRRLHVVVEASKVNRADPASAPSEDLANSLLGETDFLRMIKTDIVAEALFALWRDGKHPHGREFVAGTDFDLYKGFDGIRPPNLKERYAIGFKASAKQTGANLFTNLLRSLFR